MFKIGCKVKVACKNDSISPRSEAAIGDIGIISERDGSSWGIQFPHLDYVVFFAPWELSEVEFYSTTEAARYLNLSISGIKYHIYRADEKLCPIRVGEGRVLVFTQRMLDEFQANRRKPGRPRKAERNHD